MMVEGESLQVNYGDAPGFTIKYNFFFILKHKLGESQEFTFSLHFHSPE